MGLEPNHLFKQNHKSYSTVINLFLGLLYLILRFGFTQWFDEQSVYAIYYIEAIFVFIAILLNQTWIKEHLIIHLSYSKFFTFIGSMLAGLGIFGIAKIIDTPIPFDFNNPELIIFLLLIGPILEEFIFRFFLWLSIKSIIKNILLQYFISASLFSYAHFHSYWFVESEFHTFIIFQTTYTFFLGLICSYVVQKWKSLPYAILIHILFNFGFYIASKIFI